MTILHKLHKEEFYRRIPLFCKKITLYEQITINYVGNIGFSNGSMSLSILQGFVNRQNCRCWSPRPTGPSMFVESNLGWPENVRSE